MYNTGKCLQLEKTHETMRRYLGYDNLYTLHKNTACEEVSGTNTDNIPVVRPTFLGGLLVLY